MSKEFMISIEAAYATPEKQIIIPLTLVQGSTLYDAVIRSNIAAEFPEIEWDDLSLGVFGKLEKNPKDRVLIEGDRVEIYRPLIIDPKESRQARAEKARREKENSRREKKSREKRGKRVRTTDH